MTAWTGRRNHERRRRRDEHDSPRVGRGVEWSAGRLVECDPNDRRKTIFCPQCLAAHFDGEPCHKCK